MKELIEKLIAAIPQYIRQMIELLRNPREFIEKIDLDSHDALEEALMFLAISFALVFIAEIPLLLQKQNQEILFGVSAVLAAVSFTVSVLLLLVSWKIVGGKLTFKKFVTVSSYFTGVFSPMLLIFTLLGFGIFNGLDPENTQLLRKDGYADPVDLTKSTGYKGTLAADGVRIRGGVDLDFPDLANLSRAQWGIARAFGHSVRDFRVAQSGGHRALVSMAASLSGASPPSFPAELVGQWELTRDSRSNDVAVHNAMMFNFDPKGYHINLITKGTTNGRCYVLITDASYGHATESGPNLTLHVNNHTETTDDQCNNTKSEFAKDKINEVYQYAIRQSPDGQQLCLTGKLGEACMSPKKR
jgi:hypothetical protein